MADYDLQYQDNYIDALLATANELKAAGYIYKGVATPSTNPGTPTERVAYLASEPGTYTNFGGIVIASGLYSLTYASGTWTGTQMQAGSDIEVVQTTGDSTTDVMSQKAVTDALGQLDSYIQGSVRTFAFADHYDKYEVIKDTDGNLLICINPISALSLNEPIKIGDVRIFGTFSTMFSALKNVDYYDGALVYTSGDYAIIGGVVKKYDGSAWSEVTNPTYTEDTSMWQSMDAAAVLSDCFQHFDVTDYLELIGSEMFDLAKANINVGAGAQVTKWTVSYQIKCTTAGNRTWFMSLPQLEIGRKYRLIFEYETVIASGAYVIMSWANAAQTSFTSAVTRFSASTGKVDLKFVATDNIGSVFFAGVSLAVNNLILIKYIHVQPYDDIKEQVEELDSLSLKGTDITREYGYYNSNTSGVTSDSVTYMSAMDPCKEDGVLQTIKGKFTAGTCQFYIGHVNESNEVIIRSKFSLATTKGENTIDVSAREILIKKNEYLLVNYADSGAKAWFGVNSSASPLAWAISAETNKVLHFGSAVFLALIWTVKSQTQSIEQIRKTCSKLTHNVIVVDAAGYGDYDKIEDALANAGDSDTNHVTIMVMPGTYYPAPEWPGNVPYVKANRNLSIIGADRDTCILKGNVGYYYWQESIDFSLLRLNGNVTIKNLTFIHTCENYETVATEHGWDLTSPHARAYCIHVDDARPENTIVNIENCKMYNDHMACFGFGLKKNTITRLKNCELNSDVSAANNEKSGFSDYGTIFGHLGGNYAGQNLEIIDCLIRNKNYTCGLIITQGIVTSYTNVTAGVLLARNIVRTTDQSAAFFRYTNASYPNVFKLDDMCWGNNVDSMNYS